MNEKVDFPAKTSCETCLQKCSHRKFFLSLFDGRLNWLQTLLAWLSFYLTYSYKSFYFGHLKTVIKRILSWEVLTTEGTSKHLAIRGGRIAQWIAFLLHTQQPQVWFSAFLKNKLMLQRLIDSPASNSGQRLDHVNQTHLVLDSGKLVLQKISPLSIFGVFIFFPPEWNIKQKIVCLRISKC